MKNINEELEGHSPRWDGERWIEPDEVLEETQPAVADNATNETRQALPQTPERNAAGIVYPSIQTQKEHWEGRDIGGNTTPDRIEANEDRYGD